jgi:hypothetical protein
VSHAIQLSRGDRNRNARLVRMRAVLPPSNAVVGIDLADRVQVLVVMDHEANVFARRRVKLRAWELGPSLGVGGRAGESGRVRWGDGGVRADGPAARTGRPPIDCCRLPSRPVG